MLWNSSRATNIHCMKEIKSGLEVRCNYKKCLFNTKEGYDRMQENL